MEFSKDICFNQFPKAYNPVNIEYKGFLRNSPELWMVYGFGANWEHTTEQKMKKISGGFTTDVNVKNFDTFNFCFKNSKNEWDNNSNCNYISQIMPDDSLETLFDELFSTNVVSKTSAVENVTESTSKTNDDFDLDMFLDEFLEPIIQQCTKEFEETTENVSKETTEKETEFNLDSIIDDILNPVSNIETEAETTKYTNKTDASNPKIELSEEKTEFDLNNLVDEILNPVLNIESTSETAKSKETLEVSHQEISLHEELEKLLSEIFDEKYSNDHLELSGDVIDEDYIELIDEKTNDEVIEDTNEKSGEQSTSSEYTNEFEKILNSILNENTKEESIQEFSTNEVKTTNDENVTLYTSKTTEDYTTENTQESSKQEISSTNDNELEITYEDEETKEEVDLTRILFNETKETEESTNSVKEETSLTIMGESNFVISPRKLSKFYYFRKKIKLFLYKTLFKIPSLLFGTDKENN